MDSRSALRTVILAVFAISLGTIQANAQYTETILYTFTGGNDGGYPFSGLISDSQGNLYGTTTGGGPYQAGVVFRLSMQSDGTWVETDLFVFSNGSDGGYPTGPLAIDSEGNLYGTTNWGSLTCVPLNGTGCGVVFKLSPQSYGRWRETILHTFQNDARDGFTPTSGVTFDNTGNLYGTTSDGGAYDVGVVFELTPTTSGPWKEKVLHSFTGEADGQYPSGPLVLDATGSLYGGTAGGGIKDTSTCTSYGCGVVFKLTPTTGGRWNERVLYSFTGGADGGIPSSGLIFDASGDLFGVTDAGGTSSNCFGGPCGVVFELKQSPRGVWSEQVLYNFTNGGDGALPAANLIFDALGNLYGTASEGGGNPCYPYGCGTVFELTETSTGWTENTLHAFSGGVDGCRPVESLLMDTNGNLFGTAPYSGTNCTGGSSGSGIVYELSPTFTQNR